MRKRKRSGPADATAQGDDDDIDDDDESDASDYMTTSDEEREEEGEEDGEAEEEGHDSAELALPDTAPSGPAEPSPAKISSELMCENHNTCDNSRDRFCANTVLDSAGLPEVPFMLDMEATDLGDAGVLSLPDSLAVPVAALPSDPPPVTEQELNAWWA